MLSLFRAVVQAVSQLMRILLILQPTWWSQIWKTEYPEVLSSPFYSWSPAPHQGGLGKFWDGRLGNQAAYDGRQRKLPRNDASASREAACHHLRRWIDLGRAITYLWFGVNVPDQFCFSTQEETRKKTSRSLNFWEKKGHHLLFVCVKSQKRT